MAQQILSRIKNISQIVHKEEGASEMRAERDLLKEHLGRIDQASASTVRMAKLYYDTSRKINIVVVIVGISMLANSIIYTWLKGADSWSIFSGGIGITSFVALFFTRPQQNIAKALGNLAQIQMICKSYCLQFDMMLDYHIQAGSSIDMKEIGVMSTSIQQLTDHAVRSINSEIEKSDVDPTKDGAKEDKE